MAETDANKPKAPKDKAKPPEPKTVAEAKKRENVPNYWQLTDDEVLLRSPEPEDDYKTSDSWRVFRIMGEFVDGFDNLATITRGVSLFGSSYWQGLLQWITTTMLHEGYIGEEDLKLIHLTDSPQEAVNFIIKTFEEGANGETGSGEEA